MCRNIKTIFNFDPPATEDEVRAASIQFVRKVSGSVKPSIANEPAFNIAVNNITATITELLATLVTSAEPKDRVTEAKKAKARVEQRFGTVSSSGNS
ncbi:MAG: DUF2277 domain-containing protein [Gammaproteobacteria bacterium]|jgi:hypothetical protein